MSLFTAGDGILKTHLTWDELQKSVSIAFGDKAIFGPNKDVREIGIGNGVLSKICLISPDWQTEFRDVPRNFIVKICSLLTIRENTKTQQDNTVSNEELFKQLEGHVKRNHNTEVRFYELLRKYEVTNIPTPKVYSTREFIEGNTINGHLIMEYIADGTVLHLLNNVTPEHMAKVMKALAKLQAVGVRFTDEEKSHFQAHPYGKFFTTLLKTEAPGQFIEKLCQFGGDRFRDKVHQMEEAIPEIVDAKIVEEITKSLGMKPVLCHGDLWTTNIIWSNGVGNPEVRALIDFQVSRRHESLLSRFPWKPSSLVVYDLHPKLSRFLNERNAHFGCPSIDVVRVFSSCMSAKDRRDHWETLLEKLYMYLEEELAGHSMPYTLDMLKASYRLFFPYGARLMLPIFAPVLQAVNSRSGVEDEAKASAIMLEKAEGLVDDICCA